MRAPPRLQFLTLDDAPLGHVRQAELACAGGVRWVQLRAKGLGFGEWVALARDVVAACRAHGAICVINDSPVVAVESGADGVHLGRADASPAEARRLLGDSTWVGVTLNQPGDLVRLSAGRPDYVGVGPFRATATKPGHAPVHSDDSLRELVAAASLPAYVIGGLRLDDLQAVRASGARGAAVSSALASAPDLRAAAAEWVRATAACWGDA